MKLDPFARSGHLTDLGLEGLVLGELALPARLRAERHLRQCPMCRDRLAALGTEVPPLVSTSARRRALFGVAMLAASVVAWIGVSPRALQTPGAFVAKGSADLEIWVHDGTQPMLLVGDAPVASGDRLGFRWSLREPAYVMIVAMDAQNDWAVVFPEHGHHGAWVEPHHEQLLPVAVRLDDSEGDERFFGLACTQPFEVDAALAMIRHEPQPDCVVRTRRVSRGPGE